MDAPRKAPAVERQISEVTEQDIKVRVIGTVEDPKEGQFTLKDDTGSIQIESQDYLKQGDLVRVFGRPTKVNGELILSAELTQDVNTLNQKVYKKIKTQGL